MKFNFRLNIFSLIIVFLFLNANIFGFNDLQGKPFILEYYMPNEIYEMTINETNQSTHISLNRSDYEESDFLIAYIKINVDINLGDQINLNVICDSANNITPVNIYFFLTDNFNDVIYNKPDNLSNINELKIRTFTLNNSGSYYIELAQNETNQNITNNNCTFNYSLKKEFDNKISDDYHYRTSQSKTFYYKKNKDIIDGGSVLLTLLSSGVYDFNFSYIVYEINNTTKNITNKIQVEAKSFFNGYSIIINNELLGKDEKEKFIRFDLDLDKDNIELITINTRKYKSKDNKIIVNNHYDIILYNELNECFKFDNTNEEGNIYAFNFLSLTKNIKVACKPKNEEYDINKETKTKLFNINECNEICFNYKKTSSYSFGSLSFEVMPIENKNSIVINNTFPLIRNLWTRHYLNYNTSTFYRPEVYFDSNLFAKISFHMIKGYSKLYIDKNWSKENYCHFKEKDFEELENYPDINGFISIKKKLFNESMVLIYCPNEEQNKGGCIFDIEIKNDNEISLLYPNLKIYSFILNNEEEKFKINSKDFNEEFLSLYIYSFLYDTNITIYADNITLRENVINKYYFMKKKLACEISKDEILNSTIFLFVKIRGKKNTYFGINFNLKRETQKNTQYIENNILYHYIAEKSDILFDFINKDEEYPVSYIINLNTFGNKLKLDYNGYIISPFNDLIQKEISNNNSFKIIKENYINNSKYFFSMEYHEKSQNNKIFLENGYIYKNKLTNKIKNINYYFILFKEDKIDKIIINLRKHSNIELNITFLSKTATKFTLVNDLLKIIILEKDQLTCIGKIYEEYCEYLIEISADLNNNEELDFSIILMKYENSTITDIYLPKNTFITNLLDQTFSQNYLFEIEKNGEGKVFIVFFEGEGSASATIFNNEKLLDGTNIEFKYYKKYFEINKSYTNNCNN